MRKIQLRTKRIIHHYILYTGATLGMMGCIGHSSTPVVTTASTKPVLKTQDVVERKQRSPLQIYEPGQLNYDVLVRSALQPTTGDSVHQPDSTQMSSVIRIHFLPAGADSQVLARAEIDSTILRTTNNSSIQLPTGTFTFRINTKAKHVSASQKIDCSDTTTTIPQLPIQGLEVLPVMGAIDTDHWVDTSVVQICRGTITVSLARTAIYTVTTQNLTTSQVVRTTDMTMRGSGYQWNQKVTLTGHGTAVDTLSIAESRLQHISGNAHLEINFDSPLRHQQYTQLTSNQITLRH